MLSKTDIFILVPHCDLFINKVLNTVPTVNQQGPSLFGNFPRTMSTVLQTEWQQVLLDHPVEAQTVQTFRESILHFIAVHFDPEDQHQLLQQLRRPRKPRSLSVQTYFYCYKRTNGFMNLLPGPAQELNNDEVRQAIYAAMPLKWQNEYTQIKGRVDQQTLAEVVRFFRNCEKIANQADENNRIKQRREADARKRSASSATQSNGNKRAKTGSHGSDKCPKHPNANHTWAQCFLNPDNPEGYAAKAKAKAAKPSNNGKQTQAKVVEVTMAEAVNEEFPMTDHTDEQLLEVVLGGVDNLVIEGDDDVAMLPGLLNETGDGTFTCNDCCNIATDCYVNEALSHTHLHSFTSAAQRVHSKKKKDKEINESIDRLLQEYSYMCVETYLNGGPEISALLVNPVVTSPQSVDSALKLRSVGLMRVDKIHNAPSGQILKVLFDTGSDKTLINMRALPKQAVPAKDKNPPNITGLHNTKPLDQFVMLEGIQFPEFTSTSKVAKAVKAIVYNNNDSNYDAIIGMDVLQPLGFKIDCSTLTISWNEFSVPFRPSNYFQDSNLFESLSGKLHANDDEYLDTSGYQSKTILSSKYEEADVDEVAKQQTHLSERQQQQLAEVLHQHSKLFSGKLGIFPNRKIHLELMPDAKPKSSWPYGVPRQHEAVFKEELNRLEEVGVLSRCGASEWLAGTFIIPKKDGRVRWISDFRELNKVIKRKVYNLPRIQDILSKRNGYSHFSKLDISMMYYTF
jgi:hypothetical protein